jgi:DNA-binding transcriptional LysR family regulator
MFEYGHFPSRRKMNTSTISDIRLGWLQRFCSVARHNNIIRAARECNVDPTSLSDSVQRLEEALHRPLIAPGTAHVTSHGRAFVKSAEKVLELAKLSSDDSRNVCVGWIQCLIASVECGSYTAAAKALGLTRYKVMRGVSQLTAWVDKPLLYQSEILRPTLDCERILYSLDELVRVLSAFADPTNDLRRDKTKRRTKPWWLRTYGIQETPKGFAATFFPKIE